MPLSREHRTGGQQPESERNAMNSRKHERDKALECSPPYGTVQYRCKPFSELFGAQLTKKLNSPGPPKLILKPPNPFVPAVFYLSQTVAARSNTEVILRATPTHMDCTCKRSSRKLPATTCRVSAHLNAYICTRSQTENTGHLHVLWARTKTPTLIGHETKNTRQQR